MNHVRSRSLRWIGASALLAAIWIAGMLLLDQYGWSLWGPGMGLPLLPFLIGLTELVSGRSFAQLAQDWDELAGWQRGLLGTVIVAIAGTVIVGGVGITLSLMLGP